MAVIDEIKQRILQLDAGSFQSMCDRYLSKIGYPNIVSLGTQAGTRKTTRGTPDTYFIDTNGKYVFVEYTTQQSNLAVSIQTMVYFDTDHAVGSAKASCYGNMHQGEAHQASP